MPVLDWICKDKVINHHLDVPYRVLERKYSYDEAGQHEKDNGSENMIIHGDNLAALKSLLPRYEGGVDCIYIDPPYNTGNEGWCYNDNATDPKIKKWLGEVVGKEGEDLSRHDKWLCMMYPRLKLLQKLLSSKGVIFISCDDNEASNLRLICDEIFGVFNFAANISWQRNYSPRNDAKGFSNEAEHILVYSKESNWEPNRLPRTESMNSKYKRIDGDKKLWRTDNPCAPSAATHQGMVYAIQHPFTGELIYPYNGSCWPLKQDDMLTIMQKWAKYEKKELSDEEKRASVCGVDKSVIRAGVLGIVLAEPLEKAKEHAEKVYNDGNWPRFFFTNKGQGGIARKTYLNLNKGKAVTNLWPCSEVGHTDEAKKILKSIFGNRTAFDTPKPVRLLERIIYISTHKNSIVLDSFAGSGTTAHAVLNMNRKDEGDRKFILIEMEDYAEAVTAERVKKVVSGYKSFDEEKVEVYSKEITVKELKNGAAILKEAEDSVVENKNNFDRISKPKMQEGYLKVIGTNKKSEEIVGTGGNFSYYELGERLFIDGYLNEAVEKGKIREYVYFAETRRKIQTSKDEEYFLGININTAYYFYYEKENITTLNRRFLHSIKTKTEYYVIYADLCTLSEYELEKYHITFKKIPRDITRI